MSPFSISLVVFAASMAAGTLLGAPALMLGMRLAKGPSLGVTKALVASFCATLAAQLANIVFLAFFDRPTQSLIGFGFFAAALASGFASYAAVMKFSDVYLDKVPVVWAPYAALLIAVLMTGRVQGWEVRESHGYYRGYESLWVYNMPDIPEAMAHPEATVGFYNAQLKKLRRSAEESGMGHIMTTFTHWDLKWLNDNFQWICRVNARSDATGVERVIQDPRALKLLAVLAIARPIYGKVERSAILGREAIVKMDSGQIIRLRKEGDYWKIRDFLGMKPIIMQRISEEKKRHGALAPEDVAEAAAGFATYESDTRLLAQQIDIEYQPFYPYMADPEGVEPADRAAAVLRRVHSSAASGSHSSPSTPEALELADMTFTMPPLPHVGEVALARAEPASPLISDDSEFPAPEDNNTAGSAAPDPLPLSEKQPVAPVTTSGAAMPHLSGSIPLPRAPELLLSRPDPLLSSPTTIASLRPGDVPVETLWSVYFAALEKIERGDLEGIEEFLSVVSQEDAAWFRSNVPLLVQLVAPRRVDRLSPEQAQLAVLRAMLRNMPRSRKSSVEHSRKGGTAVAKFIESGREGPQSYTTVLALEGSRWVMVQPFFARTFIWTPQLAWYKSGRGIPLTPEETEFLRGGYEPLQQSVLAIYKSVGYSGGKPIVRHLADQTVSAGD